MIAQGVCCYFSSVSWDRTVPGAQQSFLFFSRASIQSSKIPHRLKNDSLQTSCNPFVCAQACVTAGIVTKCVSVETECIPRWHHCRLLYAHTRHRDAMSPTGPQRPVPAS